MPAPIIYNADSLRTMQRTFSASFMDGLQGKTKNTYEPFVQRVQMSTKTVELPMLEEISGLREWIGDRQFDTFKARGYSMTAKKFERSLEISREDVEDDNLGLHVGRFSALGGKVQMWPDQEVWKLVEAGETELGYDGVAFFSASHPENGGTASNLSGAGNPPWYLFDASQGVKPIIWGERTAPEFVSKQSPSDESVFLRDTLQYGVRVRGVAKPGLWQLAYKSKAALDATAFDAAVTSMMQRKNDVGESLGVTPTHLVVPASLRVAARTIVNTEKLASGADNPNYKSIEVVVCHRLSNT